MNSETTVCWCLNACYSSTQLQARFSNKLSQQEIMVCIFMSPIPCSSRIFKTPKQLWQMS